jgi:hypothetical protein
VKVTKDLLLFIAECAPIITAKRRKADQEFLRTERADKKWNEVRLGGGGCSGWSSQLCPQARPAGRVALAKRDVMENENPQKIVTVVDSIPIRSILNIQCALYILASEPP